MVDRQTREELNALSKEVFGSSSRWQKLVNQGYAKIVTEEVEETTPSEVEGEAPKTEKVTKAVMIGNSYQSVLTRYTVEGVREFMLKQKTRMDEYKAAVAKLQADAKAAQEKADLAKKLQEDAGGSAGSL